MRRKSAFVLLFSLHKQKGGRRRGSQPSQIKFGGRAGTNSHSMRVGPELNLKNDVEVLLLVRNDEILFFSMFLFWEQ